MSGFARTKPVQTLWNSQLDAMWFTLCATNAMHRHRRTRLDTCGIQYKSMSCGLLFTLVAHRAHKPVQILVEQSIA